MAEWKYWQGILVLILTVSGVGTYYLSQLEGGDRCQAGSEIDNWISTAVQADDGSVGRFACWLEKSSEGTYPKVRWCNATSFGKYAGKENSTCYPFKQVYYESPDLSNDSLTEYDLPPLVAEPSDVIISNDGSWNYDGKIYTPYAEILDLKNGKFSADVYSMQEFVLEDNIVKRKQDAKSLKGTDYAPTRLLDDGVHDFEYDDWNWTTAKVKLKLKSESKDFGKYVPLKLDGFQFDSVKIDNEETELEYEIFSADGLVGHNWSFGSYSTVDVISANNDTFQDTWFYSTTAGMNLNYGANSRTQFYRRSGLTQIGWDFIDLKEIIGANRLITNFTFFGYIISGFGTCQYDVYVCLADGVIAGTNDGVAGNSSYNSPNNTFQDADGTAIWNNGQYNNANAGIKSAYVGKPLKTTITANPNNVYNPVEFDAVAVQEQYERSGNLSWFTNNSNAPDCDIAFDSIEGTNPKMYHIEYEELIKTILVHQWVEIESISSTEIVYNLTIFTFNNGTNSTTFTLDPDDGFTVSTYSIILDAGHENITYFTNTTTRGSVDTIFFVQPPQITGDLITIGNGLHLVGPAQVGVVEAVVADKADIKWFDPDSNIFWEVVRK